MSESKLHVERVVDAVFEENAYIVYEKRGGKGWVIDPSFPPQPVRINALLRADGVTPAAVLVTHCHGDHIAGVDGIRAAFPDVEILVPSAEAGALADPQANLSAPFGMEVRVAAPATRLLAPGETLCIEALEWQVLDVSGHSPGGLAFYCPEGKAVFTGDALFAGSIGRTDMPGSSEHRLLSHIRDHLLSLPDDVVVYPGHGPSTTIGQERRTNPFLRM